MAPAYITQGSRGCPVDLTDTSESCHIGSRTMPIDLTITTLSEKPYSLRDRGLKKKSKCTLLKLPREIRHMILRPLLLWTGTGSASVVLAALRPEPDLYDEALAIFRRENIWDRLLPRTCLEDLISITAIKAIERLAIWGGYVDFPLSNKT